LPFDSRIERLRDSRARSFSGDGLSTGGHFNPEAKGHGAHGLGSHHAGDPPSLRADASGEAEVNFISKTISVVPGVTQIIGRGLIVHRDPDDFKTQPTGNAGPRLACAVIKPCRECRPPRAGWALWHSCGGFGRSDIQEKLEGLA